LCINEPKLSANPREIKLGKGWKLGECRIGEGKGVAERQKFIYFVEFMSGRNRGPTELRRRAENDPGGGEFEESVPRELKPVGFCEVVPF
jgi:hypothetical protein